MESTKALGNQLKKKEENQKALACLKDYRSSPRKMRLVADCIRNKPFFYALAILNYTKNHASIPIRKLALSVLDNWRKKYKNEDESNLYLKEIRVDSAGMLKRMRPAPQGRGHRIRKRSSHISIEIGNKLTIEKKNKKV
jgi:large subunit ribosomal protein L22